MQLVNWELLTNPVNWVIVVLMLMIAVFALHLLMHPGMNIGLVNEG